MPESPSAPQDVKGKGAGLAWLLCHSARPLCSPTGLGQVALSRPRSLCTRVKPFIHSLAPHRQWTAQPCSLCPPRRTPSWWRATVHPGFRHCRSLQVSFRHQGAPSLVSSSLRPFEYELHMWAKPSWPLCLRSASDWTSGLPVCGAGFQFAAQASSLRRPLCPAFAWPASSALFFSAYHTCTELLSGKAWGCPEAEAWRQCSVNRS